MTARTQRLLTEFLTISPVMPVVTIEDSRLAVELAEALVRGGIKVIEVTLRTPEALRAIEAIAAGVPEICLGVGTVRSPEDLRRAEDAGGMFAISPGASPALLDAGRCSGIPYLPAVATATELMSGLAAGYTHFKLFPANAAGGSDALNGFRGPFPEAKFCPTGGVSVTTARSYLALPNVLCVGGSWVAPEAVLNRRDWKQIEALAREAAGLSVR